MKSVSVRNFALTSCVMSPGKRLTPMVYRYHAEIIPEQSASKIVKLSQQNGEVMWKIKMASFFCDTVYNQNTVIDGVTVNNANEG